MGRLPDVVWADFDCQKVQHISCNTGSRALPDIVRTRPLASCVHISNVLQPVLQLLHVRMYVCNVCMYVYMHVCIS